MTKEATTCRRSGLVAPTKPDTHWSVEITDLYDHNRSEVITCSEEDVESVVRSMLTSMDAYASWRRVDGAT